jgi:hypothetical protein
MSLYTYYGVYIKIPQLNYYTNLVEIKFILHKLNLYYKIDVHYYKHMTNNHHNLSFYPFYNTLVKPNKILYILLNTPILFKKISIPNYIYYKNIIIGLNVLRYNGFDIKHVIYIPFYYPNIIINILNKYYVLIKQKNDCINNNINLIVGQGYIYENYIPNCLNLTLLLISHLHIKNNLLINQIIYFNKFLINYINRTIYKQEPCYGNTYNNVLLYVKNYIPNHKKIDRLIFFNKYYDVIYKYMIIKYEH